MEMRMRFNLTGKLVFLGIDILSIEPGLCHHVELIMLLKVRYADVPAVTRHVH